MRPQYLSQRHVSAPHTRQGKGRAAGLASVKRGNFRLQERHVSNRTMAELRRRATVQKPVQVLLRALRACRSASVAVSQTAPLASSPALFLCRLFLPCSFLPFGS